MTIKQFICGCRSRAFLLTMLLLSAAALLGVDPAGGESNKPYQRAPRSQRIPFSGGHSYSQKKEEQAIRVLRKERHAFGDVYERYIEEAIESGILREKEPLKAALEKGFCTLAARYQHNIEAAIPTKSDRDFLIVLKWEQSRLRKGLQRLIERLQRSIAKQRQKKEYDEQFPSLKATSSMRENDIRCILRKPGALNSKQELSTARYGLGFSGRRVAVVGGALVVTAKQGCEFYRLKDEEEKAAKKHNHTYINYIVKHILRDPEDHYFPFAIDAKVLQTGDRIQKDSTEYGKYSMYTLAGTLDGNEGVFEIGVGIDTHRDSIFHRMFRKDMQDLLKNVKKNTEGGGTIIH